MHIQTFQNTEIEKSYRYVKKQTRYHAKTFYFASFFLPHSKRRHAFALYAFCRYLDDAIDCAPTDADKAAILKNLEDFITRIVNGAATEKDQMHLPWLVSWLDTQSRFNIPSIYFFDLLRGMQMDEGAVYLKNWAELNTYCYHVAGVVGLMMTHIFGGKEYPEEAKALGTAMQLTNILRDVAEDYQRGRIYLPYDELRRFGIGPDNLAHLIHHKKVTSNWMQFMRFQIDRARAYYTQSEPGIHALPCDGTRRTVRMMRVIYAAILDEIERANYNVFNCRARVSFFKKCALALPNLLN